MALSDHGKYSGVVDIARNGVEEVIRLKEQAKADDALIRQMMEALEKAESVYQATDTHPLAQQQAAAAVSAARARLEQP